MEQLVQGWQGRDAHCYLHLLPCQVYAQQAADAQQGSRQLQAELATAQGLQCSERQMGHRLSKEAVKPLDAMPSPFLATFVQVSQRAEGVGKHVGRAFRETCRGRSAIMRSCKGAMRQPHAELKRISAHAALLNYLYLAVMPEGS